MYTEISQQEFEDLLNSKGYKWKKVDDPNAKENIYLIESDGVHVKVYSSIVRGLSRGVGADAIRTIGWDPISNLPVMSSEARVYRTEGWRGNLISRIDDVRRKMASTQKCKLCGATMVERVNRHTKERFMGCLNYKNHKKSDNGAGRDVGVVGVGGREVGVVAVGNVGHRDAGAVFGSFKDKMKEISERLNINIQEVKGDEPLLETKLFSYANYPFEKFNVIQSNVAKYVEEDNNVVIEAKTSTGKTIMGELFMWKVLSGGKKVIYASPLKALTREKWDSWTKKFGRYKVAIITGDYRLTDKRIRELNDADIILSTSEMLDHRTRNIASEKSEWLTKAGLLIVDEVQLIGMKDRGDKLEAGLMRFSQINPGCRLVFLSGTMPNSGQIAGWLKDLNAKQTVLIRSTWRPIKLNMIYQNYDDSQGYYAAKDNLFKKVMENVKRHDKEKILIFVHSKTDGRRIKSILEQENYGVEFHNADLETDDRINIEESFKSKEGGVRIIIATSTLAYGLNLPARIVIITGVHRGIEEVSELDIIQMAGRSGRMGIDTEGDAIILLPETHSERLRNKIEHPGDIMSQINNPMVTGFHVIGEIVNKNILTREDVYTWYNRTLASRQDIRISKEYVDKLVDYLIRNEAIKEIDVEVVGSGTGAGEKVEKRLVETELGKACTYFYLRPDMLKDMLENWGKIFDLKIDNNEFAITRALSRLRMHDDVIVSKAEKGYIEQYQKASQAMEGTFGGSTEGQAKVGMAYLNMLKGVKGVEIKDGKKVTNPLAGIQRSLQQDIERIFQALMYIDAKYARWGKGAFWNVMGLRLKYGIGHELVGLCRLEGIGGTYAKRLWSAGIRQPIELVTKRKDAIMVLGARYNGIIEKNMEMFRLMGVNNVGSGGVSSAGVEKEKDVRPMTTETAKTNIAKKDIPFRLLGSDE